MATKRAQLLLAERENATDAEYDATPDGETIQLGDRDSEDQWDRWIEELKQTEATGVVRAYKLPTDENGDLKTSKGTRQITLGSWPHQLYEPDVLQAKIVREFLKPGEIAHVKFTGTSSGKSGVVFSRIVTLQKPDVPEGTQESVGTLFKVVQEGQAAQLQTLREIFQPPATPAQSFGLSPMLAKSLELSIPILGSIITALISRPKPTSDISALIGAMADLKNLMPGGDGGGREDESTTAAIIKAVGPALPQLLEYLKATATQPAVAARPIQARIAAPLHGAQSGMQPTQPARRPPPVINPSQPSAPASRFRDSDASHPAGNDAMLAQLKPQLEMLAEIAARGEPPEEVASLLMQTLPEEFDDALSRLVETPQTFQQLGLISPAIRQHAEWFERLRLALAAEFADPDSPATVKPVIPLPGDAPSA